MTIEKVAIVTHPKAYQHMAPFPKPNLEAFEAPLRLQMIERFLETQDWLGYENLKAPRATKEDILCVHSPYLYESVRVMSLLGGGSLGEAAQASPDLLRNSLASVGGAIKSAIHSIENSSVHAFSLLRPPGHHASSSTPAGLCFFNNIAIAVRKMMQEKGIGKVSILDFDDHFGNGTSEIFYADPSVQYISVHEYDYENFGLGHYEEHGYGDAEGTNINIPLLDGASDEIYEYALERVVIPHIQSFEPEVIAVSAGFDPHYADPVGNMNIDSRTFWKLGIEVRHLTEKLDVKGSFSVFEGGYNPLATGPSAVAYLTGLLGKEKPKLEDQIERESFESLDNANLEIIDIVAEEMAKHS